METTTICEWLVAQVSGVANDHALHPVKGKLFPDRAPEKTSNPCVVYQVIDAPGDDLLDAGAVSSGVVAVQFRAYASRRSAASKLREGLRQLFQNVQPAEVSEVLRIEGSSFSVLTDTFDEKTEDYGSLCVIAFAVAEATSD